MAKKVIILGGGVAGLSAAHELVERGFNVEVYESQTIPGGKARSLPVPHSAVGLRRNLPGEHGFRFFPSFYKHLPDTMMRIPFYNIAEGKFNRHGVYGNLVETSRLEFFRTDHPPFKLVDRFPRSVKDIKRIIADTIAPPEGIEADDLEFFANKVWQLFTSCYQRRLDEYEMVGWWDFIDAETRSLTYQQFFGHGLTKSLAAADGRCASTRTIGNLFLQLLLDLLRPGVSSDRLLNGPTNDVWINPWIRYLTDRRAHHYPMKLYFNAPVTRFNCNLKQQRIESVTINLWGQEVERTADYYLAAMPVEIMGDLITVDMIKLAPAMAAIEKLKEFVRAMIGIQYFLNHDVKFTRGHVAYVDSPWALTSISQHQFWKHFDLSKFGDGTVKGILSVDISCWDAPGSNGKKAQECTNEEVKAEVWKQMKDSVNRDGAELLKDEYIVSYYLDTDRPTPGNGQRRSGREPLLVNYIGTWNMRPNAITGICNLFLASDYVRTFTDVACMEAANEAARRAVNGIISTSGIGTPYCKIWPLHEPLIFKLWQFNDYARWKQGLPWNGKLFSRF